MSSLEFLGGQKVSQLTKVYGNNRGMDLSTFTLEETLNHVMVEDAVFNDFDVLPKISLI